MNNLYVKKYLTQGFRKIFTIGNEKHNVPISNLIHHTLNNIL